jgi:hypothetical protein
MEVSGQLDASATLSTLEDSRQELVRGVSLSGTSCHDLHITLHENVPTGSNLLR